MVLYVALRGVAHGFGATAVARALVDRLREMGDDAVLLSAGEIFRALARERGMDVGAFSAYLAEHPEEGRRIDVDIDRRILSDLLSKKHDIYVTDSNIPPFLMALHPDLRPHAVVLITADPDVVARRVFSAHRTAERKYASPREALEAQFARMLADAERYREIAQTVEEEVLRRAYAWAGDVYPRIVEAYRAGTLTAPVPPFQHMVDNSGALDETVEAVLRIIRGSP